jgi:hypothetical protein
MHEIKEEKKGSKAKKFFILAFLTAIATAVATLFVKKKNDEENEALGLEEKPKKK